MSLKTSTFWLSILLFATIQCTTLEARRATGPSNTSPFRNYKSQQQPAVAEAPEQTPKQYLDDKSGLSTFGIISIIFILIVCCLVFYYGIMCYPVLCRNDKKYRFMDVSSTITAATSSSIQSMDIMPADQKH